jgi:hypothetical protein
VAARVAPEALKGRAVRIYWELDDAWFLGEIVGEDGALRGGTGQAGVFASRAALMGQGIGCTRVGRPAPGPQGSPLVRHTVGGQGAPQL